MSKIKYGKILLFLILATSIVYPGGDVGSSKVVHANETTETTETTYNDFYDFDKLPKSDIVLTDTFELITANMKNNSGENFGPSLDPNRDDVVIITQDKKWQFGGLWYKNPIDMKKDFSMLMYVNLGDKWNNGNYDGNGGADGITFTIQGHTNTSGVALENTIGANGAGLGAYAKDPDGNDPFDAYKSRFIRNALVLEFDTFYNNLETLTHDNGTPNFGNGYYDAANGAKFYGHIDLTKTPAWLGADQDRFYKQHNASGPYFRSPDNLYDATNQDLTDNRWRKVEVSWDSSTYELTYYIAGYKPIVYRFSGSEDVNATFGGTQEETLVHWGFTGSTGDSHNLQQVGIFEVPDQTESSIEKLARNITKDGENAEFAKEALMKLGDTIEYQVTLDYPAEVNTQDIVAAVIEDKLPTELNYVDGSLRVQLNGSDVTPTPDWNNGEIHLGDFKPGNEFVVTYQAVVEKEGVIDNIATFYSRYTAPIDDTAQVYSGSINILKVDGTNLPLEGAEFTVEGPNGFSVNLPRDEEASSSTYKLDYLEPGDYTITETKAPDGYLLATESQTVTVEKETVDLEVTFINYRPPKTSIGGTKTWIGGPTVKPTITIELYRDGVLFDSVDLLDGTTTYEFTDLDKTNENGIDYVYTVEEVDVDNYTKSQSQDGYDFTNTYVSPKISIGGTKTWIGGPTVKPTIIIELYRDDVLVDTVELLDGTTTYVFTDLDKTDASGKEITYSVKELPVAGYESTVKGFKVTNTFIIETTDITVTKEWVGGELLGKRPTITLELYNGETLVDSVELKDGETSHTFTNLAKTDASGKEITYSVKELPVAGYESTVKGFKVTNTFIIETTDITVTKEWVGGELLGKRPTITLELYNGETLVDSVELKDGETSHTFTNLAKTDASGKEITYSVKELPVAGYESTVKGFKVTNTFIEEPVIPSDEKTSIIVEKIWIGKPLDEVKIYLYAGGILVDEVILSTDNAWQFEFSDLNVYDENGVLIEYTVSEQEYDGYTTIIQETDNGFTIINEENVPEVEEPENPKGEESIGREPDDKGNGSIEKLPHTGSVSILPKLASGFVVLGLGLLFIGRSKEDDEE